KHNTKIRTSRIRSVEGGVRQDWSLHIVADGRSRTTLDPMRKRKTRDARIVATGIGAHPDADYRYLNNADWLNIQQRFGKGAKIPANLREQLSGLTAIYADMLQTPRLGRWLTGTVAEIELWCKRTESLKRAIWTAPAAELKNAPRDLS